MLLPLFRQGHPFGKARRQVGLGNMPRRLVSRFAARTCAIPWSCLINRLMSANRVACTRRRLFRAGSVAWGAATTRMRPWIIMHISSQSRKDGPPAPARHGPGSGQEISCLSFLPLQPPAMHQGATLSTPLHPGLKRPLFPQSSTPVIPSSHLASILPDRFLRDIHFCHHGCVFLSGSGHCPG